MLAKIQLIFAINHDEHDVVLDIDITKINVAQNTYLTSRMDVWAQNLKMGKWYPQGPGFKSSHP
jgi:hypothetical protein